MSPDTSRRFATTAVRMTAGLLVWGVVVYGLIGLTCERGWSGAPTAAAVIAITLAAMAGVGWLLRAGLLRLRSARDSPERFRAATETGTAALALVAIGWAGLPPLLVPACGLY
jgi:hypothetical protein